MPQVLVQNQFTKTKFLSQNIMAGGMKKFSENRPTSTIPEVMDSSTLNFKPNFKFSQFFFFLGGGTPVQIWVCASKPRSISIVCKNFRAQHPLRVEI